MWCRIENIHIERQRERENVNNLSWHVGGWGKVVVDTICIALIYYLFEIIVLLAHISDKMSCWWFAFVTSVDPGPTLFATHQYISAQKEIENQKSSSHSTTYFSHMYPFMHLKLMEISLEKKLGNNKNIVFNNK